MLNPLSNRSLFLALLLTFILLLMVGFTAFYSASFYISRRILDDPHGFFIRQMLWAGMGFFLFLIAYRVPLRWVRAVLPYFFLLTAFLMIITLISPLGKSLQGARRWLFIGNVSLQPSELVKVFLVMYLAHFFSKFKGTKTGLSYWLIPLGVVMAFLILTVAQNDYSTTIFITLVVFSILWVAQIPYRYIFISLGTVGPLLIWALLAQPYRIRRILTFLNPYDDLTGAGYQFIMSRKALQNGGFFGMGLGESLQKMGRLPEAYADYIFAIFAEEFGLLGVWGVLGIFCVFAFLGYSLAIRQKDLFSFYLAFGITTLIFLQALLNISIVSGLMPPTGIPLPFFSSGGSHLIVSMVSYGLLMNIARTTPKVLEKTKFPYNPSFKLE